MKPPRPYPVKERAFSLTKYGLICTLIASYYPTDRKANKNMQGKCALRIICVLLFLSTVIGIGIGHAKPVSKKGKGLAATVNGAPITTSELKRILESIKGEKDSSGKKVVPGAAELLDRLINRKLISQEGENIGLDSLPEVKMQVDVYKRQTLRELLLKNQIRDVKASDKEVESLYRDAIRMYKIKSVFMEKEEDAESLKESLKIHSDFDNTIERMVAEKKAKGSAEEKIVKANDLNPQIAEMLIKMNAGDISPVVKIGNGFTVVKVLDVVYPENPQARDKAEKEALRRNQVKALDGYKKSLYKKHVKINEKLLDGIDFEASPADFERLLGDKRVLARIDGAKPITIGDLAGEIKSKQFHGMEEAISSRSINKKKKVIFSDMIDKRIFLKESYRKKIDKTEEFKYSVTNFYENLILGAFIMKVVDPEIKFGEEEFKSYYEEHKFDFTTPAMVKIRSIAFGSREDAEETLDKLRKGMDFNWAKNNLKPESEQGRDAESREYEGEILVVSELPEHVRIALTGTSAGDYRFYADSEKRYQVLHVQEVFPPVPQPYEEARANIADKMAKNKRDREVKDWFEKLRKASDVRILLVGDELEKALAAVPGGAR